MGNSQQSFNKKEKEKKRLKKRKDKEQKMEERKANSTKGKAEEEMLAYVDENGEISSTPPDPNKKHIVNIEDIQIGVSKQIDEPVEIIRKGTVTFFNDSKGYGFIRDHQSQESIFVHINGLIDRIQENDKVTFETERGKKGLIAIKVQLIP